MKVTIDAGGRHVEIQCQDEGNEYAQVAAKALEVWTATTGPDNAASPGPAFGLAAQELSIARPATSTVRGGFATPE